MIDLFLTAGLLMYPLAACSLLYHVLIIQPSSSDLRAAAVVEH
jgi:hypothetical protein